VGGPQVSRGYLADPALTAAAFLPDPFSAVPGSRMYRTGDRGRRLGSGQLEFRGRVDDQVKIRGHRVELGEVESALRRAAGTSQAVVVAMNDPRGRLQLVGYVVSGADPAALRTALLTLLPEPMVPAALVRVERLRITANG